MLLYSVCANQLCVASWMEPSIQLALLGSRLRSSAAPIGKMIAHTEPPRPDGIRTPCGSPLLQFLNGVEPI